MKFGDDGRLFIADTEIGQPFSVRITLDTSAYSQALERFNAPLVQFNAAVARISAALTQFGRAWGRQFGPRRSGHRHRGTRAWRLRYAMASDAPLGQRTTAKLRERVSHP